MLATSFLPVAAIIVYVLAPTTPGPQAAVVWLLGFAVLVLVSFAEVIVGLVTRRRLLWMDGVLRLSILATLASPAGSHILEIAGSFVQSFDSVYACPKVGCEDAVFDGFVDEDMMGLRCYYELVRLSDPAGGRAAAVRALRRSWPAYGPQDADKYAEQASLLSLGRGFYRAVRCEDWTDHRNSE